MISNHRRYPGKDFRPPTGICRWCRIVIKHPDGTVNQKKVFCSSVCVTHFTLRSDPQKMRQHVFFRDNGICRRCGFQHRYVTGEWEADHIKPLMFAFGDPSFWEPDNVCILCTDPCHKQKTTEDRRKYRKRERELIRRRYLDLTSME